MRKKGTVQPVFIKKTCILILLIMFGGCSKNQPDSDPVHVTTTIPTAIQATTTTTPQVTSTLVTATTLPAESDPYFEQRKQFIELAEGRLRHWEDFGYTEKKLYMLIGKDNTVIGGYYDLNGPKMRGHMDIRYSDHYKEWVVLTASWDGVFMFTSEAKILAIGESMIDEEKI